MTLRQYMPIIFLHASNFHQFPLSSRKCVKYSEKLHCCRTYLHDTLVYRGNSL